MEGSGAQCREVGDRGHQEIRWGKLSLQVPSLLDRVSGVPSPSPSSSIYTTK